MAAMDGIIEQILANLRKAGHEKKGELDGELGKHLAFFHEQFSGRGASLITAAGGQGKVKAMLEQSEKSRKKYMTFDQESFRDAKLRDDKENQNDLNTSDEHSPPAMRKRKSCEEQASKSVASNALRDSAEKKRCRERQQPAASQGPQLRTEEDFADDCAKMTVKELRAELKRCEVPLKGLKLKKEFVSTLAAHRAHVANVELFGPDYADSQGGEEEQQEAEQEAEQEAGGAATQQQQQQEKVSEGGRADSRPLATEMDVGTDTCASATDAASCMDSPQEKAGRLSGSSNSAPSPADGPAEVPMQDDAAAAISSELESSANGKASTVPDEAAPMAISPAPAPRQVAAPSEAPDAEMDEGDEELLEEPPARESMPAPPPLSAAKQAEDDNKRRKTPSTAQDFTPEKPPQKKPIMATSGARQRQADAINSSASSADRSLPPVPPRPGMQAESDAPPPLSEEERRQEERQRIIKAQAEAQTRMELQEQDKPAPLQRKERRPELPPTATPAHSGAEWRAKSPAPPPAAERTKDIVYKGVMNKSKPPSVTIKPCTPAEAMEKRKSSPARVNTSQLDRARAESPERETATHKFDVQKEMEDRLRRASTLPASKEQEMLLQEALQMREQARKRAQARVRGAGAAAAAAVAGGGAADQAASLKRTVSSPTRIAMTQAVASGKKASVPRSLEQELAVKSATHEATRSTGLSTATSVSTSSGGESARKPSSGARPSDKPASSVSLFLQKGGSMLRNSSTFIKKVLPKDSTGSVPPSKLPQPRKVPVFVNKPAEPARAANPDKSSRTPQRNPAPASPAPASPAPAARSSPSGAGAASPNPAVNLLAKLESAASPGPPVRPAAVAAEEKTTDSPLLPARPSDGTSRPAPDTEGWRQEDNYVISDKEDSDSDQDDSDDDTRGPRKAVPEWAQKQNLMHALKTQYYGPTRHDPDAIFGEIPACDLQAIFRSNKKRYKQRGSSAQWHFDGLTLKEKRLYREDQGFETPPC